MSDTASTSRGTSATRRRATLLALALVVASPTMPLLQPPSSLDVLTVPDASLLSARTADASVTYPLPAPVVAALHASAGSSTRRS